MILLTSTSDLIQAVTASGSCNIDVHASYVDYNGTVVTPGRTNTAQITSAATTTVVGSPSASTQRNVKHISIRNAHASASNAITVQHYDGTTTTTLVKYTVLAGESLQYWDERGWIVIDASGGIKNAPSTGRYLLTTVKTSGTTHTTGPSTNTIFVRLQAGGGAGGGCLGNATQAGVAGGGSAGGYAEKTFAVSPNTTYTVAIGAGGTGVSNATGNAGGITTFAVGATTVTANGGLGGVGGVSQVDTVPHISLGGASPAVSTNGDLNAGGAPGMPGIRPQGTAAIATGSYFSGAGGSSYLGPGANGTGTHGTGNAGAVGFGGGGGGSLSNAAAATTGGAGSAGVIIIDEFA